MQFRELIAATQRDLSQNGRAKRCVEHSPSVAKSVPKVRGLVRAAGTSRRRSIDFTLEDKTPTEIPVSKYCFSYML